MVSSYHSGLVDMRATVEQLGQLVTDHDKAFYGQNGYWVSAPLFEEIEIAQMRAAVFATLDGERDFDSMIFYQSPGNLEWMRECYEGKESLRLRNLENAWWVNKEFRRVVTNPVIGGMAALLTGEPEIRLVHDQALMKPGQPDGSGSEVGNVGWHQDAPFFAGIEVPRIITAWIALQDTDERNGTLHFLDGSNNLRADEDALGFFEADLAGGRPHAKMCSESVVNIPAGAVSFHDGLTFHASGPNISESPRVSIALNMMAGHAYFNPGLRMQNPDANRFLCAQLGPFAKKGQKLGAPHFPRLWPENTDLQTS